MAQNRAKRKTSLPPKGNPFPLWLALAGLGLILVAAWAFLSSTRPNPNTEVKDAASLKVEKEKIDRGDIKLGTTIRDEIRVTNVGDQPLRFTEAPYVEVKAGC